MKNLKMRRDYVLIEPLKQEEQKFGSIVMPDSAKKMMKLGKVLNAPESFSGGHATAIPIDLKSGDIVVYLEQSAYTVREGMEDLHIVREIDLFAVVNKEEGYDNVES